MAKKGTGRIMGHKYDLSWGDSRYHFGTPDERAARTDNNQHQPSESAFHQIGPGDRGGSLNDPSLPTRSGHIKFANDSM